MLYCFFVNAHDRRRILHCNATKHPTSAWVIQQLRETFPYYSVPRYLIFDRGANFNGEVTEIVKIFGIEPTRTSFQSPWQNGVAERWVGSCRRDLLDHVIVLNEKHLKRLTKEYIRYYHDDRTHLGLAKLQLCRRRVHTLRSPVRTPGIPGFHPPVTRFVSGF
jgi:putative transposase